MIFQMLVWHLSMLWNQTKVTNICLSSDKVDYLTLLNYCIILASNVEEYEKAKQIFAESEKYLAKNPDENSSLDQEMLE